MRTVSFVRARFFYPEKFEGQPCRNRHKINTASAAEVRAVNHLYDCKSLASARGKEVLLFSSSPRIYSGEERFSAPKKRAITDAL